MRLRLPRGLLVHRNGRARLGRGEHTGLVPGRDSIQVDTHFSISVPNNDANPRHTQTASPEPGRHPADQWHAVKIFS